MPCRRISSGVGVPPSDSFRIATICSSLKRDLRIDLLLRDSSEETRFRWTDPRGEGHRAHVDAQELKPRGGAVGGLLDRPGRRARSREMADTNGGPVIFAPAASWRAPGPELRDPHATSASSRRSACATPGSGYRPGSSP